MTTGIIIVNDNNNTYYIHNTVHPMKITTDRPLLYMNIENDTTSTHTYYSTRNLTGNFTHIVGRKESSLKAKRKTITLQ